MGRRFLTRKELSLVVVPDADPGKARVAHVGDRSVQCVVDQPFAYRVVPVELVGQARVGITNEGMKAVGETIGGRSTQAATPVPTAVAGKTRDVLSRL